MNLRFLGQEMEPSELLRRLPSCYSGEFDSCVGDFEAKKPKEQLSAECRQYYDLYQATPAAVWDAAMESMPVCPAPEKKNSALWLFGAGVIGLFVGMLIQ